MPGIVGIIGKDFTETNRAAVEQMVKCIMHEPTYTSGSYINERLGLGIGWVGREHTFSDLISMEREKRCVSGILW